MNNTQQQKALIPLQKRPIPSELWEKTVHCIESLAESSDRKYSRKNKDSALELPLLKDVVFTHRLLMSSEAAYIVKIYNEYFNTGKPESMHCSPCVRRAVEFIRMLIVKEVPVVFHTDKSLVVFALYDHPLDFPNDYVIRCWVNETGNHHPMAMAGVYFRSPELELCERKMSTLGLSAISRCNSDDPKIIRTYI